MCHEQYWRRREEAEESRHVWMDFERTEPPDLPEPVAVAPEDEPAELEEVEAPLAR